MLVLLDDTLTVTNECCYGLSLWPGRRLKETLRQLVPAEEQQNKRDKKLRSHPQTALEYLLK